MAQNIAFLKGQDLTVVQMQIRATNSGAGYFYDHVVRFCDVWDRRIDDADVRRAEPCKGFHSRAIFTMFVFWLDDGRFLPQMLKYPLAGGVIGTLKGTYRLCCIGGGLHVVSGDKKPW